MTRRSVTRCFVFTCLSSLGDALDEARFDRQLRGGECQCFARKLDRHAIDLEHDAAGRDTAGPELRRALALAHAHFGRLFRHRHVGEDADPDAPGALHVTRHRAAGRLDLPRSDALRLDRLQAELAEVQIEAGLRLAANAAFEGLAKFGALRLQHRFIFRLSSNRSRGFARFALAALATFATTVIAFGKFLVLRHRVVFEDFAFENPDLDAARAVSGMRGRNAIIDVGAKRMQRHTTLAIPFLARYFRAAETARAIDADALRAKPHRRLHGALHGAAERDATLELLGDRVGDKRRVDFRLTHFDDVNHDLAVGELRHQFADLIDVGAFFADHHAGTRRMDGDAAFLVRALDDDF